MIKIENLTPEVYYKQSRDFQFIGRLYELVLNANKTNADILYSLPLNEDSPEDLAELAALTLGFVPRHNYTAKQLKTFCTVFPLALKNKGNIKSLMYIANALIHIEGCSQELDYTLEENNTVLNLYIPPNLQDTTILNDLLSYMLPAGMTCNLIKQMLFTNQTNISIATSDEVNKYSSGDYTGNADLYKSNTYATLADVKNNVANLIKDNAEDTKGLIANSNVYKPNK